MKLDQGVVSVHPAEPHHGDVWLNFSVSRRGMFVVLGDAALVSLLSALVAFDHYGPAPLDLAPMLAGLWLFIGLVTGLYAANAFAGERLLRRLGLTSDGLVVAFLLLEFFRPYTISRPKILFLLVTIPVAISAWRLIYLRATTARSRRDRNIAKRGMGHL
jgi:hypothetical protein